ncbi:MAG: ABC transporter ATP-binding protein [Haloarculaceae archaeon]
MTDAGATQEGVTERDVSDALLALRDVSSGYQDTRVLREVSLDVGDGETVALVGRNGAGKTTTLQTILGNVQPSSGTVTFRGEDITGLGPEDTVRKGIALVPEERRIFPDLTVRENLELAEIGGSEVDVGVTLTIDEVLEMFENLADNVESNGNALSGGEQQMLAIGRALVSGASLLMLDEPTEGLAPLIVEAVEDAIRDLGEQGMTTLLVEQNIHVALNVADYVYVIDNGQIVYGAPADELSPDDDVLDRYLGVTK